MIMRALQKNLEKNSKFNEYDEDGDGVVSDKELEHLREIKETEAREENNTHTKQIEQNLSPGRFSLNDAP